MMVKICGITNLEDALAAVDGGAAALGFNFFPASPRYIDPRAAARILGELPPGVWKVGVFVNEPAAAVQDVVLRLGLDVAQLHGDERAEAVPEGLRIWKAFRVDAGFDFALPDSWLRAEAFVLDGPAGLLYGGAGEPFDWNRARGLARRIILAGGLDETNVGRAIRAARPWGVDACSRLEAAPGKKDHGRMRRFLSAALAEDLC